MTIHQKYLKKGYKLPSIQELAMFLYFLYPSKTKSNKIIQGVKDGYLKKVKFMDDYIYYIIPRGIT